MQSKNVSSEGDSSADEEVCQGSLLDGVDIGNQGSSVT